MTGHRWIDTEAAFEALTTEIAGEPAYGFDTEFHRERTYYPQVALMQLSWSGGIALIDTLRVPGAPLRKLLESESVFIIHACSQDLEILDQFVGSLPRTLFDPQIAGSFLGMGTASLGRIVEACLDIKLDKGSQLADWTKRPLAKRELDYAASDVAHLIALRARLEQRLAEAGRLAWAKAEMEEQRARDRRPGDPNHAWWKLRSKSRLNGKSRGVAQALAAWRERQARKDNVLARTILPDVALLGLAQRPARDRKALASTRGLHGGHLKRSDEILEAIRIGSNLEPNQLQLPPKRAGDRSTQSVSSICMAWLAACAEKNSIDAAVVGTRDDVERLIAGEASRLAVGWRHELVGKDLQALMAGKRAISLTPDGTLELLDRH